MTKKFVAKSNDRSQVSTEADRKTFVRDWIARRLKAGGAVGIGMVGTLLTLPMLAAAQVREAFVNANQIDGVDSVEVMSDGSAQLTMDNGVTISVPVEEVQIAANGDVLVSDRIVDIAADVMAGGGGGLGGGALAAGLGGVVVAAGAAAAGGGGDGGGGPAPLPLNGDSFESEVLGVSRGFNSENTGIALPEGTASAEVTITDEDGGETTFTVTPDEDGNWTSPGLRDLPQGTVTVTVRSLDEDGEEIGSESQDFNIDTLRPSITIDDTGVGGDGVLNATEQAAGITISGTTDAEDGQEVTITLSGAAGDPIIATGIVAGNAFSVEFSPADLAGIGSWPSATVTAEVSDAAGNLATPQTASFDIDVTAGITIETIAGDALASAEITAADRVGGFDVTGTVTGVEDGQEVTVTINGQDFMANIESGEFTVPISADFLNGLAAGPVTLNVRASVTDLAGNTAAFTPAPIEADFTGPSITINPIPTANDDGTLNIEEREDGFEVSGTTDRVEAGSTVTVTVNGEALPGPVNVDANGDWSVIVAEDDGGTFPPNGPVTIEATVTDNDSGIPAPAVTRDLDVDLEAPTVTITTPIAVDDVLNIAEQGSGIAISGTTTGVEDGQSVTVTLSGAVAETSIDGSATVTGNAFTVEFSSDDLAGIGSWPSATVTAEVTDAAGNEATPDTAPLGIDLAAPTISIGTISGDDQIGLNDLDGPLVITGTTNAEIGQDVVSLTFNGQTFIGSVISNSLGGAEPNAWSVTVPQSEVQAVQDGAVDGLASVDVTATVTDAAGNPAAAPAEATISADFNGPSITINPISGDNLINLVESGEDIIISGTVNNVPDTQPSGPSVTLNVGTLGPLTVGIAGGEWQTSLTPAQAMTAGLADGATVNITANVTDGDGVPAPQATAQITADFTAPTVAIGTISGDDIINIVDSTDTLTISGTTTGVEAGRSVFVNITGLGGGSAEVGADGTWTVSFTPTITEQWVTDVGDGATPAITANVTDLAGNPAPEASRSVTIDVSPPSVSINPLPLGMDNVMNIAEQGTDLVISGTASDTTAVVVTFNGTPLAPVAVTGGNWTLTIPSADLAALADGATIDVQADVTDSSGNTAQGAASFGTDFTAPTIAITDTGVGPDDILNIAEQSAGITVEGVTSGVEDGQPVTIALSGGGMAPPIVGTGTVTDNAFTVEFTSGDLSTIGGWPSATVTAEVSDAADNPATPATDSFEIDLTAPTIAFDDPPEPGFVLGIEDRDSLETEGVGVITTEPDGTAVTLTFTRPDGSGGTVTDVTINTTVSNGGTFDIPLTPAQIAALQDETTYTLDLTITDDAGNTGTDQLTVPTDFAPILTIDEIGEGGAVDLSDTEDAEITGMTLGVEVNQDVTVTVTGSTSGQVLSATAAVGAGGIWTLPVDAAFFDALEPGETFTVSASVSNDAGRTASAEQADIDAYLGATYIFTNSDTAGDILTITATGIDPLNTGNGVTNLINFDTTTATFVDASFQPLAFGLAGDLDTSEAADGTLLFIGISLGSPLALPTPLYSFDIQDQLNGPIVFDIDDPNEGGPTELQIGTAGGDTLTASNTDSVIQGKGGDDSIDVSATGTNIVVFELDQASNGTDTVTGFTTGDTFQSDVIAFLGEADLRGEGDFVEALGTGGALGDNTGFVIFTTSVGTDATSIEAALEGLIGEQAGDVFYALAGDGADAALVRATVNGTDDMDIETLANFTDIGNLNLLNAENVILPDPAVG